jgi:hypothetical protein
MSSIFESLSTEGINIRIYNLPKSINQKNEHQDEELGRIKLKKNDGQLIPRRYFLFGVLGSKSYGLWNADLHG